MVTSPGSQNLIFYDFCSKFNFWGQETDFVSRGLGEPTGDLDLAGRGQPWPAFGRPLAGLGRPLGQALAGLWLALSGWPLPGLQASL